MIIVGQGMGLVVYVRNLMLVGKAKRRAARRRRSAAVESSPETAMRGAHNHQPHRGHDRAVAPTADEAAWSE